MMNSRSTRKLAGLIRFSHSGSGERSPLRRLLDDASSFAEPEAPEHEQLRWATQPYAQRSTEQQPARRERVEPRDTTVLLFPGQGSQYVGMGRELLRIPTVRDLYQLASDVVGWDVARLCTEGPAEELAKRCQTAVLVTSLAALERVREERPGAVERVRAAAGFSLGEIGALTFAGALSLESALRLVEIRAAAMRAACAERPGGMLTVWLEPTARLGRALAEAREAATEAGVRDPVCAVANYMYPGCKVIAGDEAALAHLERHGREMGVKRAVRVRVEGAFHTELMGRAEEAVRAALSALEVRVPRVVVVSGVDGRAYGKSASDVRRRVTRLTTRAVHWEQTLHALYARPRGDSFPLTLALGPGATLRATLKQVNARAWDSSLQIEV